MYRIGIDVGGTFTDVTLIDEETGKRCFAKVLNEPGRRHATVVKGILRVMAQAGARPDELAFIGHGTTITTNAVIERKGAPTALITNKGFRDIIELGRFSRPADLIYRVQLDKPAPIAPRHLRFEVDCRVNADGQVIKELDEGSLDGLIEQVRASGVQAVAVCLLFSFLHPAHEQRIQKRLQDALPHVDVLISSDIQPEFREFPRTSTTLFAAYVAPVLRNYVEKLMAGMREEKIDSRLFIFQSNGGVGRPDLVLRNPATTLLSGPAGAVVGASQLARTSGHADLITIDMGGTSLDVCLLRNGVAEATTAREIGYFPVVTPMLDVHTIGAGGGSIVTLDEVGRVKVGPESASSDPGPACYGLGGTHATLTDVNLLLGYIDADDFAGGEVKLNPQLAREVIERHVAQPLGMDALDAAGGIFKVAANQMAEAIRFVSVQRGANPRDFDLCAFGGGGPIHAFSIAQELGMRRIVVPSSPGLFSSGGIALADFTHDYSQSILRRASQLQEGALDAAFTQLRERADADLNLEGVPVDRREFQRSMDIRYVGQSAEINIRIDGDRLDRPVQLQAFIEEFHRQHELMYTYAVLDEPVEVVNVRMRAVGRVDKPREPVHASSTGTVQATDVRQVWFGGSLHATRVYRREHLHVGTRVAGPAIIQELSSATVVPPSGEVTVDTQFNLVLELN